MRQEIYQYQPTGNILETIITVYRQDDGTLQAKEIYPETGQEVIREPTPDEIQAFYQWEKEQAAITTTLQVTELLATSPSVITMPEIWELLRIFGRQLGYRLD